MDLNVDVAAGNREGPSLQQFRGLLVGNPYTNPAENNKVVLIALILLRANQFWGLFALCCYVLPIILTYCY